MYDTGTGELTSTASTNVGNTISMSMYGLTNSTNTVTNQGWLTLLFSRATLFGTTSLTCSNGIFTNTSSSTISCMVNCNVTFTTPSQPNISYQCIY